MRRRCFYLDFAAAIAVRSFESDQASAVLDSLLGTYGALHSRWLAMISRTSETDAVRLVLGIAIFIPHSETDGTLSGQVLDDILNSADMTELHPPCNN
jgi:chemotaxis regulatin CheY-phosphate phosphatase CheZ